ncbi:MAG: S9 family peptidase [Wenzhouxiangellaceae bacterium]
MKPSSTLHRWLRGVSLCTLLWLTLGSAQALELELEQIMADPDWLGPPVTDAWWDLSGNSIYYQHKEAGGPLQQLYRLELDDGESQRLEPAEQSGIDGANPVYDSQRQRALFLRHGDVYLRDLASGELRQLSRTAAIERRPRFSSDGKRVFYVSDGNWWGYDLQQGLNYPIADLRFSDDPDEAEEDELRDMQLRLFATLQQQQQDQQRVREHQLEAAQADHNRAPAPWYLGDDYSLEGTELSPDGRWLLLALSKAGASEGRDGKMPRYVTTSGYVDVEDVRTRVGRKPPAPQTLWLLDLEQRQRYPLEFDELPGINDAPLAFLQSDQAETEAEKPEQRALSVMQILWNAQSDRAAIQLRAIDNKDRWLVTLDPSEPQLRPRHRLHDEAWINWLFNDYGWFSDGRQLWLLSEESGYSQLYRAHADKGRVREITSGDYEVMNVTLSADEERAWVLSNRSHPTEYDVWQVDLDDGDMQRLTELRGVEDYSLSADEQHLLLRWSEAYIPPQVAVVNRQTGAVRRLTDTRSDAYRDMNWQAPEFVGVPSSHQQSQPIWSKFYPPRDDFAGPRPIVLFVHGAGYTQNTHHKFPYYFREQMFHNLLTERGYLVLDMDYRASRGYGRDWRTAIYRQMGHPELEDLIDGVQWLVENHQGDPDRVAVYGGSYGGFMALMAMFRAADTFAAGAALRPVTDWAHYNHGYTSNILNTPQADPEAYRKSSPIEYAENLRGHLLIAHGMLDDNVFYQDSVRLAQRLIELEKEHWELASYPMEPHSFVYSSSWLDEYRRILRLFESVIGDKAAGAGP